MSFFEPLPPTPPEPARTWSPPAWDRPSEGTLPAIVPVGEIVHRSDEAVVALEYLRAYPNGFSVSVCVLANPRYERAGARVTTLGGGRAEHIRRFPRVGIRFADGRTAGREVAPGHDIPRDADGFPTEPIIQMMGGGGGSHGFHFSFWVFPLPPDGPLEVFVSLPAVGDTETKVVLDGRTVREAASRAVVVWA